MAKMVRNQQYQRSVRNIPRLDYTTDGWQLANNFQMSRLFNDFNFGIEFDEDPSTTQYLRINDGPIENLNSPTWIFLELFGSTATKGYVYSDEEIGRYEEVSDKIGITAMFADDYTDRYQYLNTATVTDDYFFHFKYSDGGELFDTQGYHDGIIGLYSASGADLFGESNTSFAFVRELSTTEVPEPSGLLLFTLFLFAGFKISSARVGINLSEGTFASIKPVFGLPSHASKKSS